MCRKGVRTSVPMRLRARIAVVIVVFAVSGFVGMTAAGWLLVLRAEDEILESMTIEAVGDLGRSGSGAASGWVERFDDEDALRAALGLAQVPVSPGWHEVFASDDRTVAVVVGGLRDRWRVWMSGELEREFRLEVRSGTPRWILVDLSRFEFTEARADAILLQVLVIAAGVGLFALVLSALIARWTLRPVLALASRVRAGAAGEFGAGLPDDEIGFLARSIDEARAREQAALERERRFVAECSHELRTPLATLKSALTLLPEVEDEADARRRVLERMERAMARTERLVQFFLVLAREGREPADVGWVSLRQVVQEVTEEQHLLHNGDACAVRIEIADTVRVRASRDVVTVLLHNLVGNAFQHASGGRVRVVWLEDGRLRVDDDGPGFPELRTPSGAMVGRAEGVPTAGFGIGLTLSERLCRTQGWVLTRGVSEAGGARVEVRFGAPGSKTEVAASD
jgi:signal transduction histidine kinase